MVESSDDAWIFHDALWLSATQKIWSLISKSFCVEQEGKLIGIMPLQMRPNQKLVSIYVGTGGAALVPGLAQPFQEKVYKFIYDEVEHIAKENKSPSVEIYLAPLSASQLNNKWSVNPLIKFFYQDTSTHTWMIDLEVEEEKILKNFSEDARQKVKKAVAAGLTVEAANPRDVLDVIYPIHCENYKRTEVEPHPKAYFEAIIDGVCAQNRAFIFLAKDQKQTPVAYEIVGLFKKGAQYWAGACKTEHLESGVNYLLQQHAILWAKRQGARWFNHGEAFPNVREGKLKGLTVFKGKFGGELHRNFKGLLDLSPQTRPGFIPAIKSSFRRAKSYFINRK